MTELVVALLMFVQGEIKEARIQPSMSENVWRARESQKRVEQKLLVDSVKI